MEQTDCIAFRLRFPWSGYIHLAKVGIAFEQHTHQLFFRMLYRSCAGVDIQAADARLSSLRTQHSAKMRPGQQAAERLLDQLDLFIFRDDLEVDDLFRHIIDAVKIAPVNIVFSE